MQNQDNIEFFAGIIPHDERQFENFIKYLMKEDVPVEIKGYYNDPDGYHMYTIHGSWDTYKKFQDYRVIKSLSHNYE
jgi:hypothetical protein